MQQLILTKGLPASGKTTKYKEWANDMNVVITKDDLRKEFPEYKENKIIQIRDERTIDALRKGKNVCWCDTNYNPIHLHRAFEIAKSFPNTEVYQDIFTTSPEECIKRDLARETGRVGSQVIWEMYYKYVLKKKNWYFVKGNRNAVICDLDGTLARMTCRKPFEWDKADLDEVNWHIRNLLAKYYATGSIIILMSGRDAVCEELTKMWLEDNQINYHHLFMRPIGDKRDDREIKTELYEMFIEDKYNIELVLDDRPKMVRMWLGMGLPILNAQGHTDFEF